MSFVLKLFTVQERFGLEDQIPNWSSPRGESEEDLDSPNRVLDSQVSGMTIIQGMAMFR